MRNNAPVEHCAAEAFILHREIVLTMKASFAMHAYPATEVAHIARWYLSTEVARIVR